jgi:hypothetical protein
MPEPGSKDQAFPINSVVEGSITLIETDGKKKDKHKVRIVTADFEKRQNYFECAIDDYAKKVLEYDAKDQPTVTAQHYGLIIYRPGPVKLADSTVTDFISYHRHPTDVTTRPTASRYGISAYNEVFEVRAIKERALKKIGERYSKKPQQVDRNAIEKALEVIALKERVLKNLGELYNKKLQQVDRNAIEKVLKEMVDQLEDAMAYK